MAIKLAGQEPSYVQGLDTQDWLRQISINDASPGLKIVQSGGGVGLQVTTMDSPAGSPLTLQPPSGQDIVLKPGNKVDIQKAIYNSSANNSGAVQIDDRVNMYPDGVLRFHFGEYGLDCTPSVDASQVPFWFRPTRAANGERLIGIQEQGSFRSDYYFWMGTKANVAEIYKDHASPLIVKTNNQDIQLDPGTGVVKALNRLGLPQLASDPSTAGWGTGEKGYAWFNTTGNVLKYWDGSAIKTVTAT